jgi:hypothetical protein
VELTLLIVQAVWLGVLTLVVILLVRQLGLIANRLSSGGVNVLDGLEVGEAIPSAVLSEYGELRKGVHYLLFLSTQCEPCRELAPRLSEYKIPGPIRAFVLGNHNEGDELFGMLPPSVDVVSDPAASSVAELLSVRGTPFVVETDDGIVSGKAYLQEPESLHNLAEIAFARKEEGRSVRVMEVAANGN